MIRGALLSLVAALCVIPAVARAQSVSPAARLDVSFNAGVLGGSRLAEQAAEERSGASGQPFRLFRSETRINASNPIDVRVGFALTSRYVVEGRAAFGRATLQTSVADDFEAAPAATLSERISQYTFEGGLRVHLDRWRFLGFVPFAAAGAGYLRQLHENRTLVDERPVFYIGGGAMRTLFARPQGFVRGGGVRGDVRFQSTGGSDVVGDDLRRPAAASGGVFIVF